MGKRGLDLPKTVRDVIWHPTAGKDGKQGQDTIKNQLEKSAEKTKDNFYSPIEGSKKLPTKVGMLTFIG